MTQGQLRGLKNYCFHKGHIIIVIIMPWNSFPSQLQPYLAFIVDNIAGAVLSFQ